MLDGWDPWHLEKYHGECSFEPRLRSGLEMAMWDLCGHLLGGFAPRWNWLPVCKLEIASLYVEQGFSTLKTKAGST